MFKDMSKQKKAFYVLSVASALLGFVASKFEAKENERVLNEKVNTAILQACVQVGMLEEVNEKED